MILLQQYIEARLIEEKRELKMEEEKPWFITGVSERM